MKCVAEKLAIFRRSNGRSVSVPSALVFTTETHSTKPTVVKQIDKTVKFEPFKLRSY